MAMTSPVLLKPQAMEMTAPVAMSVKPEAMAMTAPVAMSVQPQAMAMTAPVAMSVQPQAMEMTAPVAMSPPSGESGNSAETMAFVLPFKQYPNVAAAPVPTNQHVSIREKPGGIFAVLQAHGPRKG